MARSVEERVEDYYKNKLAEYGVRIFGKAEDINAPISKALKKAFSKQGGNGANLPDIKILLEDEYRRAIPVIIEAKGLPGKLEKVTASGEIVGVTYRKRDGKIGPDGEPSFRKGDPDYSAIADYAVNGALHYGRAILEQSADYNEVIVVGLNGTRIGSNGFIENPEHKAYYVSRSNGCVPKHIEQLDGDLVLFSPANLPKLYEILDGIGLSDEEKERAENEKKADLEKRIKNILKQLNSNPVCRKSLGVNERLYFLTGLLVAGMKTPGVSPLSLELLCGNDSSEDNDGTVVLGRIKAFLVYNGCSSANIQMAMRLFAPVFSKESLWKPVNDESLIKGMYRRIAKDIVPLVGDELCLTPDNPLMKALTDWTNIEKDVVFTPRYVSTLMARLARVGKDSIVWDPAMGNGCFLVAAMDLMVADAAEKIRDSADLKAKIDNIRVNQVAGVEMRDSAYGFALLNMILMGNCAAPIVNGSSLYADMPEQFDADVVLMNPPCDTPGAGLSFVYKALCEMTGGYACVLVRENTGRGLGGDYGKDILKNNTLVASIRMPESLFIGDASSQTAIYLFQVNRPHEEDDLVSFVDFSNDGYSRHNKRRADDKANLKDVDNAVARYDELVARITGKEAKTSYYTEANGLFVKDTISMAGGDWAYGQHVKIDFSPSHDDFVKTVNEYLGWKLGAIVKGEGVFND